MTIKGLSAFLKSKGISPYTLPLSAFKGKKISIDVFTDLYSRYKIAVESVLSTQENILTDNPDYALIIPAWVDLVMTMLDRYINAGILPVICYDGAGPESKAETRKKRTDNEKACADAIKDKKALAAAVTDPCQLTILRNDIISLYIQSLHPRRRDITDLLDLIRAYGFPVMQATGEGEQLASELCRQGYTHAVHSNDHDCLMYNPSTWIKKYDYKTRSFICYDMEDILSQLGLTYAQFVDMCIFMGCDHNQKIYWYGGVEIHKDIKKFGNGTTLINMTKSVDFKCVKYDYCVEYFSEKPCEELVGEGSEFTTDMDDCNHEEVARLSDILGVSIRKF